MQVRSVRCEHFDYSVVQKLFGKPSIVLTKTENIKSTVDIFEEIKDENGTSRGLYKFIMGSQDEYSSDEMIKMKWITNYPLPVLACLVKT